MSLLQAADGSAEERRGEQGQASAISDRKQRSEARQADDDACVCEEDRAIMAGQRRLR